MTPADVTAIRTRLGLTVEDFADRVGISIPALLATEAGRTSLSTLKENAIRWVEHTGGARPGHICGTCDGVGTLRRPDPARPHLAPRVACEACDGRGVARFMEASL